MKLKPTDLRIGNYYQFTDKEGTKIEQVWFIQDCGFDLLNEGEASPIPLTEDWLIKFGFKQDVDVDYRFYLTTCDYEITLDIDDFCVMLGGEIWLDNFGTKVQYVHTLQNLYHALTGTELTLNKDHE